MTNNAYTQRDNQYLFKRHNAGKDNFNQQRPFRFSSFDIIKAKKVITDAKNIKNRAKLSFLWRRIQNDLFDHS